MDQIYADIAARTGGNIYVGVVGPVRTGKSTLIKRIMEELVIPGISDPYRKERARDELPQSGSGKTIMTSEPKFVPEEAVEISPDGVTKLRVRLIDSVGLHRGRRAVLLRAHRAVHHVAHGVDQPHPQLRHAVGGNLHRFLGDELRLRGHDGLPGTALGQLDPWRVPCDRGRRCRESPVPP